MTLDTLKKAQELSREITKLQTEATNLGIAGVTLEIRRNGNVLHTIGTEEMCEHPDAQLARDFVDAMIARRNLAIADLNAQFDAL